MDKISPNFAYLLSLTRSTSGSLCAISCSNRVMSLNILLPSDGGAIVRPSDNSS